MPPTLAQRVLAYIRKHDMMRAGDRVAVAVSGGADSVALLRLLLHLRAELGIVLSVVHFNHKIRGDAADADEQFVGELAATHGLDLHTSSANTPAYAKERKLSLEAAARELRYGYFESLVQNGALNKVATAHTLDDQAETVLLRIIRGTGIAGLGGIATTINYAHQDSAAYGTVVRPLLGCRRSEVEAHLRDLNQPWREDATNADVAFTRNRVRHTLLPLLEREFNPSIKERLGELANSAASDEEYCELHAQAEGCRAAVPWPHAFYGAETVPSLDKARLRDIRLGMPEQHRLDLAIFSQLHRAARRRLVRNLVFNVTAGAVPDFQHVESVLDLVDNPDANASVDLPRGIRVYKKSEFDDRGKAIGKYLVFSEAPEASPADYSYPLPIPGEVHIPELNSIISARLIHLHGADRLKAENISGEAARPGYNLNQLVDPQAVPSELTVRNWRPGDRFWPAHTATPKKIKELLQQRHITGSARQLWPVVVCGAEIVWLKDFPVRQGCGVRDDSEAALLIEVRPL